MSVGITICNFSRSRDSREKMSLALLIKLGELHCVCDVSCNPPPVFREQSHHLYCKCLSFPESGFGLENFPVSFPISLQQEILNFDCTKPLELCIGKRKKRKTKGTSSRKGYFPLRLTWQHEAGGRGMAGRTGGAPWWHLQYNHLDISHSARLLCSAGSAMRQKDKKIDKGTQEILYTANVGTKQYFKQKGYRAWQNRWCVMILTGQHRGAMLGPVDATKCEPWGRLLRLCWQPGGALQSWCEEQIISHLF